MANRQAEQLAQEKSAKGRKVKVVENELSKLIPFKKKNVYA